MDPKPLTAVEQYAYTNGACHLFLRVAGRVVGGTPTALMATDPRQKRVHDWPEDEPLELHVFLALEDGRVVDGEGVRSLDDLLGGFGVEEDYSYETCPAPAIKSQRGQDLQARLERQLEQRLRALGWGLGVAPEHDGALDDKANYQRAGELVRQWWPQWEENGVLPEHTKAARPAAKPGARRR